MRVIWTRLAIGLLGSGCLTVVEPAAPSCVDCHSAGEVTDTFTALGQITDPEFRGVGAHVAHAVPSRAVPVPCTECHTVPTAIGDEGHIDTPWPAEVPWGDLAKLGGASVPFDNTEPLTCTVYCHGTTLTGGEVPDPTWTGGPEASACTSCHGNPPPPPHPTATACSDCHERPAETEHVDGIVQLSAGSCAGCHGEGEDDLAPPPDTNGQTDTRLTSVGAHDAHMTGNGRANPVACGDCHVIPAEIADPGHLDDPPAEVVFGGISGALAAWNGATCTDTSCHDRGGAVPEPDWTTVDGSQSGCGACHQVPPPPPAHPPDSEMCENCHTSTSGPGLTIADPSLHVNGLIDL